MIVLHSSTLTVFSRYLTQMCSPVHAASTGRIQLPPVLSVRLLLLLPGFSLSGPLLAGLCLFSAQKKKVEQGRKGALLFLTRAATVNKCMLTLEQKELKCKGLRQVQADSEIRTARSKASRVVLRFFAPSPRVKNKVTNETKMPLKALSPESIKNVELSKQKQHRQQLMSLLSD